MNIRQLKKSRKRVKAGDVFVMKPGDMDFVFGRVVSANAQIKRWDGCILIYIYNAMSSSKVDVPLLDCNDLLVPPIMTNRLPWSRGYFETVAHVSLGPGDRIDHCFLDPITRKYFDDQNREVNYREPCGICALSSFRTIDDRVSEALGLPLSEDDE